MLASFETHIFWEALTSRPYWHGALLALEVTLVSLAAACVIGSAYMSEISRAGLLSVDPGQELAARALGMTRPRILRRVIVPQAIRIVIPPTGNEFITLYLVIVSVLMVIQAQLERRYTWSSVGRRRRRPVPVVSVAHDAR